MKHFLNDNFTAVIYNILNKKIFFFLEENHIQGSCIYKQFQYDKRKNLREKRKLNNQIFHFP